MKDNVTDCSAAPYAGERWGINDAVDEICRCVPWYGNADEGRSAAKTRMREEYEKERAKGNSPGQWRRPTKECQDHEGDWVYADFVRAWIRRLLTGPTEKRPVGGKPCLEEWDDIYLRYFLPEFSKQGGEPRKGKPKHWHSINSAADWLGDKISESGGHSYSLDHLRKVIRKKLLPWAKQGITSFAQ